MTRMERRGMVRLENPVPLKDYKYPRTMFVHYESMAGESLAFAVVTSPYALAALQYEADRSYNLVPYRICDEVEDGVRLVWLPSQVLS